MSVFKLSNIKIRDFIQAIESGKYRLPCFQRDFKWNPSKIKSLINSIQHEYPAGSLLFLKVNGDNPLIPAQGFKYSNESNFTDKAEMLVLDGQQRMTSCYTVFNNYGYYTYYIDFMKLMNQYSSGVQDYDFETIIVNKRHNPTPMNELSNGLFPLAFLKDRTIMRNQIKIYVNCIKDDESKKDECDFLNYEFGDIVDSILDYEFPIIELPENSTMESVCKVFQTINTTGLKLSVFDICVAVFMPKGIQLKDMVKKSSSKTKYAKNILEKDPTSALQVVALLANKDPKSNTLPKELEAQDITDYWDDAINGVEDALALFDSYGAGTKKNLSVLPYTPMVPIVAGVLSRVKYRTMPVPTKGVVDKKIKAYFFTVSLSSRYTEGTNAKIKDDFISLNQWISNNVEPKIITNGVDWNTSALIQNNKNSAFGKAVLCMLNSLNPMDFYLNKPVGIGEHIDSCDLHHIFPKATYENEYKEMINSVFNFTWLLKDTNIYIKDLSTAVYLNNIQNEMDLSNNQIKALFVNHNIDSDCFELIKNEKYDEFINYRAEKFKELFTNAGVVFRDVEKEDIEVEEIGTEEDEDNEE